MTARRKTSSNKSGRDGGPSLASLKRKLAPYGEDAQSMSAHLFEGKRIYRLNKSQLMHLYEVMVNDDNENQEEEGEEEEEEREIVRRTEIDLVALVRRQQRRNSIDRQRKLWQRRKVTRSRARADDVALKEANHQLLRQQHPELRDEMKRQIKKDVLNSWEQCFRTTGDALVCLRQVRDGLDTSKIADPIPVAPPIVAGGIPVAPPLPQFMVPSTPPLSTIPTAPPIPETLLTQVLNEKGEVAAIVTTKGTKIVSKPFTPAPDTEVLQGTPAKRAAFLADIENLSNAVTISERGAQELAEVSKESTEHMSVVAITTPQGEAAVQVVTDIDGSMQAQEGGADKDGRSSLFAAIQRGTSLKPVGDPASDRSASKLMQNLTAANSAPAAAGAVSLGGLALNPDQLRNFQQFRAGLSGDEEEDDDNEGYEDFQ